MMKVGRWTKRSGRLALLLAFFVAGGPVAGAQSRDLEYRVKAAFLYNFTRFVDWPAGAFGDGDDKLTICVVGPDPFGASLDRTVSGKTTRNYTVTVRRIRDPDELTRCEVLFIGDTNALAMREWVERVNEYPVLTVSDDPDFVELGGMIEFVIVDGKIRFDINQEAARRSQLQMSSKLLSLARTVVK